MNEIVGYLTVGDIKKALENISDDTEVFIHNVINPIGNISELGKIERNTYGSFWFRYTLYNIKISFTNTR